MNAEKPFYTPDAASETVLCDFDRNWFSVIDPERHGLRFERATTLGYGGTHCPFHFYRVNRP